MFQNIKFILQIYKRLTLNFFVFIFRDVYSRESDEENAIIKRDEYIKSTDITAWVTAENVLGSALSEESVFNTGHIGKSCLLYYKTPFL